MDLRVMVGDGSSGLEFLIAGTAHEVQLKLVFRMGDLRMSCK